MLLSIERRTTAAWRSGKAAETVFWAERTLGAEAFQAPADLGEWVTPATVLAWAVEEVEGLQEPERQSSGYAEAFWHARRQTLLTVLVYAYARGTFDSEGIAQACRVEEMLQRHTWGSAPFPMELQGFRRANRGVLEIVLAGVFLRAIRCRFDLDGVSVPAALENDLHTRAAERLNIARHMDSVEDW